MVPGDARASPAAADKNSPMNKTNALALALLSLLALAIPAGAAGMFSGAEFLREKAALKAIAPPTSLQVAQDYSRFSGMVVDITADFSGTIGSGSSVSALLVSSAGSYMVAIPGATQPPMGARLRVLARLPENSASALSRMTLVGWSFATDVERAATAPPKTATISPALQAALDARKRGSTTSRGGAGRVDHTDFFQQYAKAIAGFNPRLTEKQVNDITLVLLSTSRDRDIDPRLIIALVLAESSFNPNATSRKGAMGLGQLMPATAKGMGLSDPYEPTQNLDAAIKILRSGLDKYSGKAAWEDIKPEHIKLALAAYNAGSGAVKKYGGVPPYRETQNYIVKVTSYYKKLCGDDQNPG